jgi:hypothetical protein
MKAILFSLFITLLSRQRRVQKIGIEHMAGPLGEMVELGYLIGPNGRLVEKVIYPKHLGFWGRD